LLPRAALRLAFLVMLALALLPAAARAQTVVSLTWDDGIKTQMLIRQSLLSHGMRGTFHINSGTVGSNGYYMNWSDVDALNADGNEIAGHTIDHRRLPDLTATEQRRQICDDATALRARGYTVNTFAYPYGAGSTQPAVKQALLDCGYLSARKFGDLFSDGCSTPDCPYAETIPPANPYGVRTPEWHAGEYTLADLESWVTQAETSGGGWVPIVFHDICNQCADVSVSVANLNAFLDWLQPRAAANGTVVKTVRQVVAPTAPSPAIQVTKSDAPTTTAPIRRPR
jgi:peptidoglycan/xylan/chitin deacetylase (PgdA/CDA1 family)